MKQPSFVGALAGCTTSANVTPPSVDFQSLPEDQEPALSIIWYTYMICGFERLISMNPNDGSAYFYRSMTLGGMGQADRARADLNRACDLGLSRPWWRR